MRAMVTPLRLSVSQPVRIYNEATVGDVDYYINKARIRNPRAFLVIKADQESSFGTMEGIMKKLQEQNRNRFQIVTTIEQDI